MSVSQINQNIRAVIADIERDTTKVTTYNQLAPVYDFLFGERYEYDLQAEYVRKNHHDSSSLRVVEAGCGTGRLLKALAATHPDAQICGVDIHKRMVELARSRTVEYGNVDVVRADVLNFDGAFDVVAAFNLLPHFGREDLEQFFATAGSLLSGEGTLVFDYKDPENNPDGVYDLWEDETDDFLVRSRFLTVYDGQSYYAVSYEFEDRETGDRVTTGELMRIHFQRPSELKTMLRAAGFQSVKITEGVGDQSGIVEATR